MNDRDKRALKLLVFFTVAMLIFLLLASGFGRWQKLRLSLAAVRRQVGTINPAAVRRSNVPAFEMPLTQEKQKFLFRDKLGEQLKNAGLKTKPLKDLPVIKSRQLAAYKLIRIQCEAEKTKFTQILDLLSNLNDNPYLVGIEELKLKRTAEDKQEFDITLTVSSFAR